MNKLGWFDSSSHRCVVAFHDVVCASRTLSRLEIASTHSLLRYVDCGANWLSSLTNCLWYAISNSTLNITCSTSRWRDTHPSRTFFELVSQQRTSHFHKCYMYFGDGSPASVLQMLKLFLWLAVSFVYSSPLHGRLSNDPRSLISTTINSGTTDVLWNVLLFIFKACIFQSFKFQYA